MCTPRESLRKRPEDKTRHRNRRGGRGGGRGEEGRANNRGSIAAAFLKETAPASRGGPGLCLYICPAHGAVPPAEGGGKGRPAAEPAGAETY
jgi:hypothetical protein